MDGRTDMTRLAVAFPADALKLICRFNKEAKRETFTTSFKVQRNSIFLFPSLPRKHLHFHLGNTQVCVLLHNSEIKKNNGCSDYAGT
jgi:hypothetical protein